MPEAGAQATVGRQGDLWDRSLWEGFLLNDVQYCQEQGLSDGQG